MPVIHCQNESSFNNELRNAGGKLVVVDFFATWCGPCKAIAPTFESLSAKYSKNGVFIKVDVDQSKDLAQRYGVTSMPTFVFIHKQATICTLTGGSQLESETARLIEKYSKNVFESKGGKTLGGGNGKRVNPWADPNFRPGSSQSSSAAAHTKDDAADVVCNGDSCQRVKKSSKSTTNSIQTKSPSTSSYENYNSGSSSGTQTIHPGRNDTEPEDSFKQIEQSAVNPSAFQTTQGRALNDGHANSHDEAGSSSQVQDVFKARRERLKDKHCEQTQGSPPPSSSANSSANNNNIHTNSNDSRNCTIQ